MRYKFQIGKWRLFFFLTFVFFASYFLILPKSISAACWCENGWADNCRCGKSCSDGTTDCDAAFSAGNIDGINIYCDTQLETTSFFATRSGICGSAPESIPYCCSGVMDGSPNDSFFMCWGGEFAPNTSYNIPIGRPFLYGSVTEPLIWNGVRFCNGACNGETLTFGSCASNVTDCNNPDFHCTSPIPDTPTSCEPQPEDAVPPIVINPTASVCGLEPTPAPPGPPPTVIPFPSPYVPCDETRDEEFHSLRPYQASPCNQGIRNVALYCGNDLIVNDTISITKNYFPPSYEVGDPPVPYVTPATNPAPTPFCIPDPADPTGHEICNFRVGNTRKIAIDLSGAELPIMGYTEPSIGNEGDPARVINSRYQDETVSDAQKVNEYASWYSNGVNQRAEYNPPNADTAAGQRKIIDLSGPLKKLLSYDSQIIERQNEINKAGITRHNQIISCQDARGLPVACYPPLLLVGNHRIQDYGTGWRPPLRRLYNNFLDYLAAFIRFKATYGYTGFQYIPFSSTEDRVGRVRIADYRVQPVTGGQNITSSTVLTQVPADLFFPHMKEVDELANSFQQTFVSSDLNRNARPQGTLATTGAYCDTRAVRSNPGDQLFPGELVANINFSAMQSCRFVVVGNGNLCRSADGDATNVDCRPSTSYCRDEYTPNDCPSTTPICGSNCASGDPPGGSCWTDPVSGDSSYGCFPNVYGNCNGRAPSGDAYCGSGFKCALDCSANQLSLPTSETCSQPYQVTFNTVTETPLATSIWSRLVASPVSVFRRFFPKVEDRPGVPVRSIWDLPASTSVTYTSLTPGVTVSAGNPGNNRGEEAQLYFPHIGGIQQYFLQCIQTALRPKGYATVCPQSAPPPEGPPVMTGGPIDAACMAGAVTDYMNQVISDAGNLIHVRFLSPAFNMTSGGPGTDVEIAANMIAAGANFDALDGIAGNSYNCCGNTITGHVTRFLTDSGLGALNPALPVMITETGTIGGTLTDLGNQIGIVKNSTSPDYLGALFFNVFNNNGGWSQFAIADADLPIACHGTCGGLGANSATYYNEGLPFYDHARGQGMTFVLSISNADEQTTEGVLDAFSYQSNHLTPIIRVGTVDNPGPDAGTYAAYLRTLDAAIENAHQNTGSAYIVYAIAGPNEPQSEHWVAPECELSNMGGGQ